MPYMILALLAGFGRLDRDGRGGGGEPRRFAVARVPARDLAAQPAGGGARYLLCFVLAMSAYITPKLLGGGRVFLLATEIYEQAMTTVNWPAAAALALYTLVL